MTAQSLREFCSGKLAHYKIPATCTWSTTFR